MANWWQRVPEEVGAPGLCKYLGSNVPLGH